MNRKIPQKDDSDTAFSISITYIFWLSFGLTSLLSLLLFGLIFAKNWGKTLFLGDFLLNFLLSKSSFILSLKESILTIKYFHASSFDVKKTRRITFPTNAMMKGTGVAKTRKFSELGIKMSPTYEEMMINKPKVILRILKLTKLLYLCFITDLLNLKKLLMITWQMMMNKIVTKVNITPTLARKTFHFLLFSSVIWLSNSERTGPKMND